MIVRRRTFFGAATMGALAGCTGAIPGLGDDATVLGSPSETRGEVSHPTHGEEFPDFSVPEAFSDETVTRDELLAGGPFVMTFIYTSCQDRCGELMGVLNLIQHDAIEEGWDDDVSLVPMTWDPATDDPETLREYAERYDVDVDHDRLSFLRPASNEDAIEVVDENFGVPAHHGHDHGDDDHEGPAEPVHYYMIFLVNGDGVVERSYPGPILFNRSPDEIIDDVRTVVT